MLTAIEPVTERETTKAGVIRAFAAVATGVEGRGMAQSPPIPVLTIKLSNSQVVALKVGSNFNQLRALCKS